MRESWPTGVRKGLGQPCDVSCKPSVRRPPCPRARRAHPPPPHSRTRRCPPALRSVWNTILLLSDKEAAGASSKYRWPGANDRKENADRHSRLLWRWRRRRRSRRRKYLSNTWMCTAGETFSTGADVLPFRINGLFIRRSYLHFYF